MSNRLVKCYGYCGEKHPQSIMQKISGKNYCPPCYEKRKAEEAERQKLNKYIAKIFNMKYPDTALLAQVKRFHDQDGYSYKNIRFTLQYIIEIKKIRLQRNYGILLVGNYHDEMIEYYKNLKKRNKETKERIKKNHARPLAKTVLMFKDGELIKTFKSSREAGKYAVENGICSYGWVGRSLSTGEATKPTRNFPVGGYRFVYEDDKIKL
ncbi:hypothetical protein [Bacillus thermotolerans]|uniref:Uncharacterized protein n=1 Tax=Bacillus thermotolerans TaxID=1221996 RepID=A0A0F5IBS2_BACTR|nr:hypothetical protein [Bacillus thermotolerans]KKB42971.1 hypothetical protein QY95_03078 [Bacillus thermotolerans]KKB43879.1 hypothetical protein QY96_00474 [Bacillus thermotolerans]